MIIPHLFRPLPLLFGHWRLFGCDLGPDPRKAIQYVRNGRAIAAFVKFWSGQIAGSVRSSRGRMWERARSAGFRQRDSTG